MKKIDKEYAEGRTYDFLGEEGIRPDLLETIPYEGPKQRISYITKEFSAVCPFSGLPDYGTVWIKYVPNELIIELKSLKYYYLSYRNVGIYQEAVTARIFKDIWELIKPEKMVLKTKYNVRGGIDTVCKVHSKDQKK